MEAADIIGAFEAAGAKRVQSPSLLNAETLLDLYGEDIRARAYVTHDPILGEQMLRPDFTVPIVEQHMREGAEPARYCYAGPVWRKQDAGSGRANEYDQIGYEIFDRTNRAAADAEVFALFAQLLPKDLTVVTGDGGLLHAAVAGLDTTERRKAALLRHLWRPKKFRALIERFSGRAPTPSARMDLIVAAAVNGPATVIEDAGKFIGLRSQEEIEARISALSAEDKTPDLSERDQAVIEAVINTSGTAPNALKDLKKIQSDFQGMGAAIDAFEERVEALGAAGVDVSALRFEGGYGLTSMEYYDGFVFGFLKGEAVVATGGRYDALTRVLGLGDEIPAVGGVIRPDVLEGA